MVDIDEKYASKVFVQDYSKKPIIEGVKIVELRNLIGEDGAFAELLRLNDQGESEQFPGFKLRQISRSHMTAGSIKAWHIHNNQEDIWHVPSNESLFVGLLDIRKDSPTKDMTMRLALGGGKAHLLYIPRGVAHGAANFSKRATSIIYFVNQQFNIENPDEHRLPWDILGEDFWKPVKG